MSNVLRIKRRNTGIAGTPAALASAEIAYNEVDGKLYYGFGNDGLGNATSIIAIAGPGEFATKTYVDGKATLTISDTPPTLTAGALWWDSIGCQLYVGYDDGTSLQWVPSISVATGIGEAPTDGRTYGRQGSAAVWHPALPLDGGTLTGPLTLAADPTANLDAATKQYADARIARSEVTGAWAGALVRRDAINGQVNLGLGSTVAQFLSGDAAYPAADVWYRVAAFSTGTGCALIHVTSVVNGSWDTQVRTLMFTWWSGSGGAWGYSLANLGGHGTNLCQQYGVSPNVNLDMHFVGATRAIEARVLLLAGDDPGVYGYGGTTIPMTVVAAPVTPINFPAIVS